MRTTLKRGMGRAATLNGNGRAVLPPIVVEPVRRYRQPEPPRRSTARFLAQCLGWAFLAVLVIGGGIAGGSYLYAHQTLNAISAHSAGVKKAQKDLHPIASPSQPATALLIGYDARAGSDGFGAAGSRSDTVMLVRADPTNNTLSMLSFPRDLVVPIYCNGSDVPRVTDRINSAWSTCGAEGTLDTVEHLTGLPVNYLITIDFHGFKLLVNKLHGVYIQVDRRYLNTQGGPGGFAKIDLEPGYQKLDGEQALDYVRYRHTDSDLYRTARQQLFIEALKDRFASGFSLLQAPAIIGSMKHSIEIGRAGGGSPSMDEILSYAGLAYHLQAGHLFRNSLNRNGLQPYGPFNAELIAPPSTIAAAVDSFENPDVTLPTRANATALGMKPKPKPEVKLQPSQVSTLVLNGTTIAGFARDTSYKVAQLGYHAFQLPPQISADAPSHDYTTTRIYYDPVQAYSRVAAQQIAALFGQDAKIAALTPEIAPFAQEAGNPLTVVIVGTDFTGNLIVPTPPAPAPVHEAASVTTNPGLTLSSLQDARARKLLHFKPLVPHTIASGSTLSSLDGFRVYKPAPHTRAAVMTFVTGAGNVYYQVEETNWMTAPIIRNPTGHFRANHRTYQLYTVGGHIHMIVLRRGGASYWVVNTLLDELSNETMIAIAKGLQPLGK
jgi:LCP family protein required for cell wall assembly